MMADGLTTILSSFGPRETMDRLEAEVKAKGLTVFARVDHAAGAAAVGMPLRPIEVLIFGNARGGTPLMEANQSVGIDLPLKAFVHQDAAGKVWLSYNNPSWIAQRHGLDAAAVNVKTLADALDAFATQAVKSRSHRNHSVAEANEKISTGWPIACMMRPGNNVNRPAITSARKKRPSIAGRCCSTACLCARYTANREHHQRKDCQQVDGTVGRASVCRVLEVAR